MRVERRGSPVGGGYKGQRGDFHTHAQMSARKAKEN